jgi:hypothetical protein
VGYLEIEYTEGQRAPSGLGTGVGLGTLLTQLLRGQQGDLDS